jgi:uncharacterized membrane protein
MAGKTSEMLTKAATDFASAKAGDMISNLSDKLSGNGNGKDSDEKPGFVETTATKLGQGEGPVKAAFSGIGASVKKFFTRKGGSKRPTNIVEERIIGVPRDVCFAAWTQFEEFPSFMKGPENVARGEERKEEDLEEGEHPLEGEETQWTAKVFINRRQWKATTVDYDPPKRLSWKTEGAKGTIDGTVTFTEVGDNATLVVMVLEYRPKGLIEWVGNRWRAVPRRAKLDFKHFSRYVMRTEPDDLPEPEEAEEIPDEAKAEDASNAEDQESEEESGDIDETDGEEPDDEIDETGDSEEPEDEEPEEESEEESEDEPEEEEPAPAPARNRRRNS